MALYTTLDETLARLVGGRVKTPSIAGDKLVRRWEFIDATLADSLVDAIADVAGYPIITNPQADGQPYPGTFAIGSTTAQAQGDRAVTVTQELTLINTITSTISTLTGLSPLKVYDNTILRAWNLDDGEGDKILWRYKNINPSNRAIAMAYTDTALETALGATAGTYKDRRFEIEEDGTATFTIVTDEHTFTNNTGGTALANTIIYSDSNYEPQGDVSGINRTKVDGGDGIPSTVVEAIRDNQVADSGWAITDVSISEHSDGSASLRKSQVKKREPDATDLFRTRRVPSTGTQEETEVLTWYNLSNTDAETLIDNAWTNRAGMASATIPAPALHLLKDIDKNPIRGVDENGDQMFNVVRVTYIPRNSTGGFFGNGGTTSHYLFGYLRKKDSKQVGVESIWTNSLTTAETFAQGGTVGDHTKAAAVSELNLLADLSGWTTGNASLIGYDGSNHTGVRRLGDSMYKATRVWGQSIPWG